MIKRASWLGLAGLVLLGCGDGSGPSASVSPEEANKWIRGTLIVQEDVDNPCNGEVIHLTSEFSFGDAFSPTGGQKSQTRVRGTGFSDAGTTYELNSVGRASLDVDGSERTIFHERVVGSAPGSSFTSQVILQFHPNGPEGGHTIFRSRTRCG